MFRFIFDICFGFLALKDPLIVIYITSPITFYSFAILHCLFITTSDNAFQLEINFLVGGMTVLKSPLQS